MSRNARQWEFIISSYSSGTLDHLSHLSPDSNIIYVSFAICDDDAMNRYLHGIVKFARSCSVGAAKKVIGDAIFRVCECERDVLMEIHLQPSFVEIGVTPIENFRGEILSFKSAVGFGLPTDLLMEVFPHLFTQFARQIQGYIEKNQPKNQPTALVSVCV